MSLNKKSRRIKPTKTVMVLVTILTLVAIMSFGLKNKSGSGDDTDVRGMKKDSVESVKAFKIVYKVLMSPRCMNCHPSGNSPLQGDDSHIHSMLPKRGQDGKGVYAMKCSNCHQPVNIPGEHTPPGHDKWLLPPADMKMVFQGRTPRQLAKQLMNPNTNGHKTTKQLIDHADDGLVLAAWDPGQGRTLPPVTHAEFKKAWLTWINTGAYAPK